MNQLNQFHAPSFGDDMFDMPTEPTNHASQRMLSLDHSTFNDDDEEDGDNTYGRSGGGHSIMTQQHEPENHQQILPQLPPAPQQQALAQAPSKPLAPFALFFRDTVTAIKQQNPACSLEQISVIVQTMWDSLDETQKNVYSQRHEQEKRDYVRHMRDYRQQLSETEINPPEANNSIPDASVPAIQTTDLITPNIELSAEQTPALAASTATPTEAPPEQIQLLTEAAQAPKCTREQCNKPAIINPDWEDEYCSNECVVIHCRNVFNDWALSLKNSPT